MKILIVDDSKAMRMIILRTLRQAGFEGHTVLQAANGAEALAVVQAERPELVISDWNMPGMSGPELVQELSKRGSSAKVGFITSEGTAEMKRQAVDLGVFFFLTKPFTVDSFREAIGLVLR